MLTDEQCDTVIEWLERHEFTGFTREDIRLFDALVSAARSQSDAEVGRG
jgi:hypothetical protein